MKFTFERKNLRVEVKGPPYVKKDCTVDVQQFAYTLAELLEHINPLRPALFLAYLIDAVIARDAYDFDDDEKKILSVINQEANRLIDLWESKDEQLARIVDGIRSNETEK